MNEWVCKRCAEKDPDTYRNATLFRISGICEKCDAECPGGLYVPPFRPEVKKKDNAKTN